MRVLISTIAGALFSAAILAGCGGGGSSFSTPLSLAPQIAAQSGGANVNGTGYKSLYSFKGGAADGANPNYGDLIKANGLLYGNTYAGGASGSACPATNQSAAGCGTVFAVNPSSGAETVLYSFDVSPQGAHPWSGLIKMNGVFYGTTFDGGAGTNCSNPDGLAGCGTVFKVSTSGTGEVLYSFRGETDGQFPQGNLLSVNGALYGNTNTGGANGNGSIFQMSTSGEKSILYSFKGVPDGANPEAPLIDVAGELYSTTGSGGTGCPGSIPPGCGTVFRLSASGSEKVLHRFAGSPDGGGAEGAGAGLIAVNGTLYGTTPSGGNSSCSGSGCGTVFKISTSGKEQVVHSFKGGKDGAQPLAGLINVNGTLYSTTQVGGAHGYGTIFKINPSSGTETVIYSFQGEPDGAFPQSGLALVNGVLYGTTHRGGANNDGIVFRISP